LFFVGLLQFFEFLAANMPIVSVHNANYLRKAIKTHSQKVCSLYKRAVRDLESWEKPDLASFRYKAVLLRARFDENKDIKDMRKAKILYLEGEEELWMGQHWKPIKFSYSPGGICYERYFDYPDWHLDYWHPLEKAAYPHYFARREQRKIEYVKLWESRYGRPAVADTGVEMHANYGNEAEPKTDEERKYGPFTNEEPIPGAVKHH
jgi:NADH dehydrogenase (ubiquinone) 1 beta subcomplex subunit 9